jgi:GT2 family glycosyltransferase
MQPLATNPLVSIITVNFNNAAVTMALLKSLRNVKYANTEVIVVDNASKEDPGIIATEYPEVILIRNKENQGFAGGNNRGIEAAKGDIIFLLNNDTEVDENFLQPVVSLFATDANIGIVSSKLIYFNSDNIIQYAGGEPLNPLTGRGKFIGTGEKDTGQYNTAHTTSLAHGAAMAIHRRVFDKIGLLPEMYFLYYEELDFSEHAIKSGFTIWVQPLSVVYHKESMSVGKDSPIKVYYQNRNRLLFISRNSTGFKRIISTIFFVCAALPVASFRYISKGKWQYFSLLWKGFFWNIKRSFI